MGTHYLAGCNRLNRSSLFITTAASLSASENNLNELQREIAVKMKENTGYYSRIDDSLGKFITEEIVWRDRTKRNLKLLMDNIKNIDRYSEKVSDKTKKAMQRVLLRLPELTKEDNWLSYKYLKSRFPDHSDTEIVEELKRISLADLLQISHPSSRIVFALPETGVTKVNVYDSSKNKVKMLVDAELPGGQYRIYWDFTNDHRESLSSAATYTYEILINGEHKRAGVMEPSINIYE